MAMQTYDFAYGRGRKTFTVEEDRVLKVVRTEEFPPMEDIRGGVLEAIRHPIGCPSIEEIVKPGDTVAFICNDPTRVANSFDFMPVLVDEMNRLGVKDEDMKIVFALGTHRAMTHEEMVEGVGENVASRLKMYNSICTNDDDFEYFGTTSRGTPVHIHKELCNRRPRDPHGHDRAPLLLRLRRRPKGHPSRLRRDGDRSRQPQLHARRKRRARPHDGQPRATRTRWRASRSSPRAARSSSSTPS